MEKSIVPKIKKNAVVLAMICTLAVGFLYVVGQFTELHPDAYRDLIRSIVFGYGIYLAVYGAYHGIYKKIPAVQDKGVQSVNGQKDKSVKAYKETPLEAICVTFMVITALNSIMMLTGLDTPKEGIFAYIHMMTRIFIISMVIGIWMFREVLEGLKNCRFKNILKNFYQDTRHHFIRSIAKTFTFITAAYCILVIAFQSILHPPGGTVFYQSLLGILLFTVTALSALRIIRSNR